MSEINLEKLVAFAKQTGFVFQGSEIYGGLANTWDYGPLGVELKNNVKKAWWKKFVQESPYNVGLDAAILMNPKTWVASGHVGGFSDPLTDCKACKTRHRADKLIEDFSNGEVIADGWDNEKMLQYINENNIVCPKCGELNYSPIREFNLMFKTQMGVTTDSSNDVYLRPETCQGIFTNFNNVVRTSRKKIPFGIGQIGKSFRNEITPGNFIYRTREFEQMELEFFCEPGTELEWFDYWKQKCMNFLTDLGVSKDKLRFRDHDADELSHYSNATTDIEYKFPWTIGELWGIASRTNFDLNAHSEHSGVALQYHDTVTNKKYTPYVIEPSVGVERLLLTLLFDAYDVETLEDGETREVLRLHPALAPVKVAVLPLVNKLKADAEVLYGKLAKKFNCEYDTSGKIGKRYRRQDAIGTPFCITVDFDTLEDNSVTVRERDTMNQERVNIDDLEKYIAEKLEY